MLITREAILKNPENQGLLAFLGETSKNPYFAPGSEVSPFDEGGCLFFGWAARVPGEARVILGTHNLLVHPISGRIFAFHQGRLTVAVQCNFAALGVTSADRLRVGETLDGPVDLRPLGPRWALLQAVGFEQEEQTLEGAYRLALALG